MGDFVASLEHTPHDSHNMQSANFALNDFNVSVSWHLFMDAATLRLVHLNKGTATKILLYNTQARLSILRNEGPTEGVVKPDLRGKGQPDHNAHRVGQFGQANA